MFESIRNLANVIQQALETEFPEMSHHWSGDFHVVGANTDQPRVWAEFISHGGAHSVTSWVTLVNGECRTAEDLEGMEEFLAI